MSEVTLPVPCEVCGADVGEYCRVVTLAIKRRTPSRQRSAVVHRPRLVAIVRHRFEMQGSA